MKKDVPARIGSPDALAAAHTRDVFYGYDLKGRPVHARFDSHTGEGLAFAYDALDRMTSTTQAMDGSTRTLGYGYDATGQLSQLTHPDGQYLRYVNDRLGRTSEVWRDTTHKLVAWVYNKPGQLTQKRNGTTTEFAYLADGRFASFTLNAAGTSQDNVLSATFNAAGQLASRSQSNDAYAFTGSGNFDHGYVSNGLNQYTAVQGIAHSYDANGNLTGDGTNSWTYDVENRLVAAHGLYAANLRYDPLGRLHETVTNVDDNIPANDITVRRLYDGGALVAEYDQTGAMLRRYVHGPNTGADTPLVWYEGPTMSQAAARMLNTDLQGSVTSVTDFGGEPIAINRYDEYGRPQSGNVGRFQYTGQAWLPEIGLYYYKARMYSPTLGRFMQTDPIGYADGVNWYNYVGGDPVNFVDPTGLEGLDIGDSDLFRPRSSDPVRCNMQECPPREGPWWPRSPMLGDGDGDEIVVTGARRNSGWGGGSSTAGFSMHELNAYMLSSIHRSNDDTLNEILVVAGRRGGRANNSAGPVCRRARTACEVNAIRLYDLGYESESFELRQMCFVREDSCLATDGVVQTVPNVIGGVTHFPPRDRNGSNGGGMVIHRRGEIPRYLPATSDPLARIPRKQ